MDDFKKNLNIVLHSKSNSLFIIEDLKNKNFEFNNLYLTDTSFIDISITDKKGKLIKPKGYIRTNPLFKDKFISISKELYNIKNNTPKPINLETSFVNDIEFLDEVELKVEIKYENAPITSGFTRKFKIDDSYNGVPLLQNFIESQGFRFVGDQDSLRILSRRNQNIGGAGATVYIDDIEISDSPSEIFNLQFAFVTDFDEIFISKGFEGEIYLYSKEDFSTRKTKPNALKYKITNGYSIEKEYYQPNYLSTRSSIFKDYGAIQWLPDITIDKTNSINVKFPSLDQENIVIYIEGITSEGALIHEQKLVNDIDTAYGAD